MQKSSQQRAFKNDRFFVIFHFQICIVSKKQISTDYSFEMLEPSQIFVLPLKGLENNTCMWFH